MISLFFFFSWRCVDLSFFPPLFDFPLVYWPFFLLLLFSHVENMGISFLSSHRFCIVSPPPYCRSLVFLFVLAHKAPLIYMLLFFPSLSPIFTVSFVTLLSSIRRQCRFQRMVTSRSNQPPPRIGRREEKKGWLERVVRTERENKSTIFFFWSCSFTAYIVFSFISVSTLKKEEPKLTKRFFCCFWCCSKQKERDLCNSADQKVLLWKDSPALFFLFFFYLVKEVRRGESDDQLYIG